MARDGPADTARRWRLVRARREAISDPVRRLARWMRPLPDASGGASTSRPASRERRGRWLLLGALCVVLGGALAWVVYGTAALGVRKVEVSGSQIAGAERVRSVAAVAAGTPLAAVDTDEVSRRVRTLPSVASAVVTRSWPHTLRIAVTERVALAAVEIHGAYALLDADGVAFHTVARRPAGLVLVRVARPGPDDPATRAALRVAQALTPALRERLRVLVAETARQLRLELRGGGVIVWGDAEHNERKAQVATSLLADAGGKTIDVSAPEVVTVG